MTLFKLAILISLLSLSVFSHAGKVQVAVASNFYKPMQQLAAEFEASTGHQVQLSAGSTGSLFAQISHGAPFDVFLSADQRRPIALVEQGLALAHSQFTYAQGRLALWTAASALSELNAQSLTDYQGRLAIANPKTAPYGVAAIQVLEKLGLQQLKLVQAKNISQTFQYVSSGVVLFGFIAYSQLDADKAVGSFWLVPDSMHSPLKQDALLLKRGINNPAAQALLSYLQSEQARVMIRSFGYKI